MPAAPENVVRAIRQARVVNVQDIGVQADYASARDGSLAPDPGYFESGADATAALAIKASLIAAPRSRFVVQLAEELAIDPVAGLPSAQLKDSEQGFDGPTLIGRYQLDLESETSALEVFG